MNDNKCGPYLLVAFGILIFVMVRFSPKSPEINTQKKLNQSECRGDSLQEILDNYEAIKHEIIKLGYDEKYKPLHNEVDSNNVTNNYELLFELLSKRDSI